MARKGKWSVEQKTEIVLANLRGEAGVSELARKHGIAASHRLAGFDPHDRR